MLARHCGETDAYFGDWFSGYIGQALVPYLLEHGYSVSGIDIGWFGQANQQINLPNFTLKNVNEIVADDLRDVDVIIHLAAVANDPSGDQILNFWETNVLFTNSLISAAVAAGVKRFIFASLAVCMVFKMLRRSRKTLILYHYLITTRRNLLVKGS